MPKQDQRPPLLFKLKGGGRNRGHNLMVKFANDEVTKERVLACFRYSTGRAPKLPMEK